MKKQKKIFLETEGNAWFQRNNSIVNNYRFDAEDSIVAMIKKCLQKKFEPQEKKITLLEIGCSDGTRLDFLTKNLGLICYGIEPSIMAVKSAQSKKLMVLQGTADSLPYEKEFFDYVVFGFCLYLCDREDLFEIAKEANRVLKPSGWLIIQDFYADSPMQTDYRHFEGLHSYKMDYRRLFDWHPDYHCFAHEVRSHRASCFTDDPKEWVATSVLRKKEKL